MSDLPHFPVGIGQTLIMLLLCFEIIFTDPVLLLKIQGFGFFDKKEHTDRILRFLEENFSHIVVGYSDEIREKMETLI